MEESSLDELENGVLFLVPDEYKPTAKALFALLWQLGLFLSVVRPLLNRLVTGGPARTWLDALDLLLDKIAGNSKPLAKRVPPRDKRKSSVPPLAILALALLTGCAGSLEQRTRTTLDTLALIVEPASQLAYDQCQREKQALAEAGKGADLDGAIERCAKVVDAFDRIATLQDAAATALESGHVQQAADMAKQVASLWRGMRGGR